MSAHPEALILPVHIHVGFARGIVCLRCRAEAAVAEWREFVVAHRECVKPQQGREAEERV
jgi:Zn ribbon nucleic-acid-binding protein